MVELKCTQSSAFVIVQLFGVWVRSDMVIFDMAVFDEVVHIPSVPVTSCRIQSVTDHC